MMFSAALLVAAIGVQAGEPAPVNRRFESGDRVEFNVVPAGEQLPIPFTIDEVELAPGPYHWRRYRIEGEAARSENPAAGLIPTP
jgi:hypothetical protein